MYSSLRECVSDLERHGHLIRVTEQVDPHLEMAEIQRRVYEVGGPAVLYTNVRGSKFACVSNMFGSPARTRFIFRKTLETVQKMIDLKVDPSALLKKPWRYIDAGFGALHTRPKRAVTAKALCCTCRLSELPQIQSWPDDGGPFITLPQVYSEHPDHPGTGLSNLGMYRIQLAGNEYVPDQEVGLHYQIHRSIGVHHAAALRRREPLRVSIFVGGPPAHTVAAVMPLPEGLSELMFAGALAGRRFRFSVDSAGHVLSADADFVLTGTVYPDRMKPEGPFGDHLGYYSLKHEFPFVVIDNVYHRRDAIWPFTVVGRPPQEDTGFGDLIHEITGPVLPTMIAGLKAVHAVDAAGVHPLLLAIGSERYTPYEERRPMEILTIANALLGQGQLSLAKYLLIVAAEDNPALDIHDIRGFFVHALKRVRWETDLHFQTRTTMDTLDYTGDAVHEGSKLVIAAAGKERRSLNSELPASLHLPDGFKNPSIVLPGVLAISGSNYVDKQNALTGILALKKALAGQDLTGFPLVLVVDDSSFVCQSLNNFLWVVFTRSNPAADIDGVGDFCDQKHWGCRGSLIIDARIKPHHAPPLIQDPVITRKVNELASKGHSLHGIL